MAADEFSFQRFRRIAQAGSAVSGTIIALVAGPAGGLAEMALRAIGGGVCGYLVSACFYLLLVKRDLAALKIPYEELNQSEVVLLESAGSMVHYKSGRPLRFWEATGGRLFLTSQVLEFQTHGGQPWAYRLTIPLEEIARATPCKILGMFPGGLRVERKEGGFELFSFGALRNSPSWASAILAAQTAQAAAKEVRTAR